MNLNKFYNINNIELTMNENVQNVISRLRFLAKIQYCEKINAKELFNSQNLLSYN